MSLKKCIDCGTQVSDKAEMCPKCARPNPSITESEKSDGTKKVADGIGQVIGVVLVLAGLMHYFGVGFMLDSTLSSCANNASSRDVAVCNCIKSESRKSLVVEKLLLGYGQPQIEKIMHNCKI